MISNSLFEVCDNSIRLLKIQNSRCKKQSNLYVFLIEFFFFFFKLSARCLYNMCGKISRFCRTIVRQEFKHSTGFLKHIACTIRYFTHTYKSCTEIVKNSLQIVCTGNYGRSGYSLLNMNTFVIM
jgi:hypothetical protein